MRKEWEGEMEGWRQSGREGDREGGGGEAGRRVIELSKQHIITNKGFILQ